MTEHNSYYLRQRRSSPVYDRSNPLLIGPGGEIVTAAPAQDDPRITGLLPEDLPKDDDSGGSQTVKEGSSAASSSSFMQTTTLPSFIDGSVGPHATATSMTATSFSISSVLAMPVSSSTISTSISSSFSSTNPVSSSAATTPSSSLMVPASTASPSAGSPASQATSLANASASSPAHDARLRLGIAVGAVASLVSLAILLLWCVRGRNRSRREEIRNNNKWPWDRDDQHLEGGFGDSFVRGFKFRSAWVGGLDEKLTAVQSPPNVLFREGVAHSTCHVTLGHSPYPTVEVPNAHGSVPDLAPDLGRLQVTNYAPGDVSSDGGSHSTSRASSISSHHRTSSRRSRKCRPLTWSLPPLEPANALLIYESKEPIIDVTELPELPAPGELVSAPPEIEVISAQAGWTASLRFNIVNAFQSVLRGTTNGPDTNLTAEHSSPANEGAFPAREDELDYLKCVRNINSSIPENDHGDVSSEPNDTDLQGLARRHILSLGEFNHLVKPMPAVLKTRDRRQIIRGTISRASSVYSTESTTSTQNTYTLPDIPNVSRVGSESSLYEAVQIHGLDMYEAHGDGSCSLPRPANLCRATTNDSACSADYDMSRAFSNASRPLNDGERFARHVLRERHKKVTANKVDHVKHSLRRPEIRLESRNEDHASHRRDDIDAVSPGMS